MRLLRQRKHMLDRVPQEVKVSRSGAGGLNHANDNDSAHNDLQAGLILINVELWQYSSDVTV
jgi:hypothetical protein